MNGQPRDAISRWQLTPREAAIVMLVAQGDANKAIAARLNISVRTVEVHVSMALKKAGVDSRSRLIAHFWMGR